MKLVLLKGGPHDGDVAEGYGNVPFFMLTEPRPRGLLDQPDEVAVWQDGPLWYAVPKGGKDRVEKGATQVA